MKIAPVSIQPRESKLKFKKNNFQLADNVVVRDYTQLYYPVTFGAKKQYSKNELDFLRFRKAFCRKEHKRLVESNRAYWNFQTNATDSNEKEFAHQQEVCRKFYCDKKTLLLLMGFKKKGIYDPVLEHQLDAFIGMFENDKTNIKTVEEIDKLELEIQKTVNNHRCVDKEKKLSGTETNKSIRKETDKFKKVESLNEKTALGDLIADKMVKLIKKRNELARELGFSNYFEYRLNVNPVQLYKLLENLDKKTENLYDKIEDPNQLKADGIKPDDNLVQESGSYIKNSEMLLQLSHSMFAKMGWDLSKLPIEFDLFPREGKNKHYLCFDIDQTKDVRILANIKNNFKSFENLNHEIGHSVYYAGISDHIPYLSQRVASQSLNEAMAILFGTLPYREEDFLKSEINMPSDLVKRLSENRKKELIRFVRRSLLYINFEKKMYENPDQDLPKLWYDLSLKFLKKQPPSKLDNTWATISHYLSFPVYYQNYLRAELIAAQIYDAATEKLGPLTHNPQTADFFRKRLFRLGSTKSETEAIEYLTGKPLSADSFFKQLV